VLTSVARECRLGDGIHNRGLVKWASPAPVGVRPEKRATRLLFETWSSSGDCVVAQWEPRTVPHGVAHRCGS
jgi:hypothetical protein